MTNEIERRQVELPQIKELEAWGNLALKAGILPSGTNIYQAQVIIQTGKELGYEPMQSLRHISFIKGRICIDVKARLADAKARYGVTVKSLKEGDDWCEVCLKRGEEEITCRYTKEDATKAGLTKLNKDGSIKKVNIDGQWKERYDGAYEKYQRQMLRWRALGDALNIICPEAAMLSKEEAATIDEPFMSQTEEREKVEAFDFTGHKHETPPIDVEPQAEPVKEEISLEVDGEPVPEAPPLKVEMSDADWEIVRKTEIAFPTSKSGCAKLWQNLTDEELAMQLKKSYVPKEKKERVEREMQYRATHKEQEKPADSKEELDKLRMQILRAVAKASGEVAKYGILDAVSENFCDTSFQNLDKEQLERCINSPFFVKEYIKKAKSTIL